MGTPNIWRGDIPATADVWTLTITGTASGSGTVTATIGTRAVSVAFVNLETASVVAQRLADALASSTAGEFLDATWEYTSGGNVVGTGTRLGWPIDVVLSGTAAVGFTYSDTNTTPATGPNFGNAALNWSLGHVPGNSAGEDMVVNGGPPILFGLDAVLGGSMDGEVYINAMFTESFGLPQRNTGGQAEYVEYRQRYADLRTGDPIIYIGQGSGTGLSLGRFQVGDAQQVHVYKTGTSLEENTPTVDLFGVAAHDDHSIHCYGGSLGWCVTLPVTSAIPETLSVTGTGVLWINSEVVNVNVRSGQCVSRAKVTGLYIQGGEYNQEDGEIATITADSGIVRLNHSQATDITAVFRGSTAGEVPVLDLTGNDRTPRPLAGASSFTGGAYIMDPYETATLTGVTFDKQSLQASDIGQYFDVTRA